jgi:hypothetical protein
MSFSWNYEAKAFFFISWFTGPPMLKFPISENKNKLELEFFFSLLRHQIFKKNSRKPTNKKKEGLSVISQMQWIQGFSSHSQLGAI